MATGRETALTTDGTAKVLNGTLDWVYEEEIYGRGQKQAYWWSPDSSRIAFLQIDDNPVPTYITLDDIPYDPNVERWDYPKAGDPNPIVKLGVVAVTGGPPTWIDTSKYPAADRLIVRVGWTPDSRQVAYEVQNRTQTWLDLDARRCRLRHDAHDPARDRQVLDQLGRLFGADMAEGRIVLVAERAIRMEASLSLQSRTARSSSRSPTANGSSARSTASMKRAAGFIFSGTERSYIGGDVYRIKLDGTGMQRLSKADGTHSARFSPGLSQYIDFWSDARRRPRSGCTRTTAPRCARSTRTRWPRSRSTGCRSRSSSR